MTRIHFLLCNLSLGQDSQWQEKKELESSIIGGKAQTVPDEVKQAKTTLFKAIAVSERPEGSLNSLC